MARCTSAVDTAESTPPESAEMTRALPTCARMRSICSEITLPAFQSGAMPATWCRKFSSARWPKSLCFTSGCHCTPYIFRSAEPNAATGVTAVLASTSKPSGAFCTASPWLIHTFCVAGWPASSAPPSPTSVASVAPYSRSPVLPTSPPSARAITWKP